MEAPSKKESEATVRVVVQICFDKSFLQKKSERDKSEFGFARKISEFSYNLNKLFTHEV